MSKKGRRAKKTDRSKGMKREELWHRQFQRIKDFIDKLQREMEND